MIKRINNLSIELLTNISNDSVLQCDSDITNTCNPGIRCNPDIYCFPDTSSCDPCNPAPCNPNKDEFPPSYQPCNPAQPCDPGNERDAEKTHPSSIVALFDIERLTKKISQCKQECWPSCNPTDYCNPELDCAPNADCKPKWCKPEYIFTPDNDRLSR